MNLISKSIDGSAFLTAFVAIFVAEFGDKTQLATLSLAAGASYRWSVFAGSALALVANTALAILAADLISRWVSPALVQKMAGVLFIVLGVVFLVVKKVH